MIRDGAVLAGRLITGRQLNGERKTNARWTTPGTELRDGAEHAGWWAHLPLRRRAGIRVGLLVWFLAHLVGLVVDFDRTVVSLRVEFWLAFGALVWVIVHKTRKWSHHTGYVVPVAAAVAEWLGMSRHVEPASLVVIPLGHRSNPDKPVRVSLPPTYREPHRRQQALATMVAARAGIKSFDWEVQLEGDAPFMLVRAMLVPPDSVPYSDERVAAVLDACTDPGKLFLGLGLHDAPVYLDWNLDSPHLALSIGSGGGKSTTTRSLAAQTVRKGGRAVLCDGGKDGESHEDWARDEELNPIPGVDFHPSIPEEHDALIAWEAERARRARAVLNRTGEVFQRVLLVLEERNLTTPKLAAYWSEIREKEDPTKSPAIQATANLVAAGRSVNINVLAIAQRFDAAAIGGGAVRSSFGLRVLSRFDEQARRMLIPEITPKPKSSNHLGRMLLCVQGEARDVQGTYMSTEEAVALCREGGVPVGTCGVPTSADRGRPRSGYPRSPGDSGVPGGERGHLALVPPTTDENPFGYPPMDENEPADEPLRVSATRVDDPEPTDAPAPLVTLSEAWKSGLVGGEWEALRKAARRPGFPEHVDEGARGAHLYRPAALAGWWLAKVEKTGTGS